MKYQQILEAIRALPAQDRKKIIDELTGGTIKHDYISTRREKLLNRQVGCPHCKSLKFYRYGHDKGCSRFMCKDCKRTFTEFTGTWVSGLHKKELVNDYLDLMDQQKSLDKIKVALKINKKTAFDWRHKILSSLVGAKTEDFEGIVESDETFFRYSQKGNKKLQDKGRKRGSGYSKRGSPKDKVAVIVTADRKGSMDLSVASIGGIDRHDIENAIGYRISKDAIICSDGSTSYKSFASENELQLVVLRADLKQFVKQKIYHIQNVNSLHNNLKKWIDSTFWGVSTKYLQNYLYWFKLQQICKKSTCAIQDIVNDSLEDLYARYHFRHINDRYQRLIATLI